MSDERHLIIESMEKVRVKRVERLADLSHEAQRLIDWREHVRAAPLAAVTASVLIGTLGVSKLLNRSSATRDTINTNSMSHQDPAPAFKRRSVFENILGTVTTLAMPLLANAVQKQLATVLQTLASPRSQGDEQPIKSI